ncbi:accessory Sec system protein Asp2 [Lactobacillaceae bacterium L1_55_11]|nr:accessory Sec system protein Asp2 [Lactobacillaceae bacterium L1_55_11]
MSDISILQVGSSDWTDQVQLPGLTWQYVDNFHLPELLAQQRDPYQLEQNYVLLTDLTLDSVLLAHQIEEWPPYRVIYLADWQDIDPEMQDALSVRRAFHFEVDQPQMVAQRILRDLYMGQVGFPTRFSESQFMPHDDYRWHLSRHGRFSTKFHGDFGDTWRQLGTLKTFPGDFGPGQTNLISLDYDVSGSAEVALELVFFSNGRLQQLQYITGNGLTDMTSIVAPDQYQDYQIIVLGRGEGEIDLHAVHQRRSRHGLGLFLPGGQRQLTSDGQEVLSYFNPGTRPGPLVVLFAGTRLHIEGFEMMGPLDKTGLPYLLFTDSRTQGGVFDIGSPEYEELVVKTIQRTMASLGLTGDQVIMAGYSMGSYPALYYAPVIKPAAVVAAKPILNLGTFTEDPEFPHNGVNQDWTLDVRRFLTGRMDKADTPALNKKLWDRLADMDWSNTQLALFTMEQDEYDGASLPQLLDYAKEKGVRVDHQSQPGYHVEKINEMVEFMVGRIENIANQMGIGGRS